MPLWEIRIERRGEQTHPVSRKVRTVGTYRVFHDGEPVDSIMLDGTAVALSGTTAEAPGPGDNSRTGKDRKRIEAGRYRLATWGGDDYMTYGYSGSSALVRPMPALHLLETRARTEILIHPGKNAFLSAIGCINLCTRLDRPAERIDYPGSRRRVIALIRDLEAFVDGFPGQNNVPIPGAFVDINGEP